MSDVAQPSRTSLRRGVALWRFCRNVGFGPFRTSVAVAWTLAYHAVPQRLRPLGTRVMLWLGPK